MASGLLTGKAEAATAEQNISGVVEICANVIVGEWV